MTTAFLSDMQHDVAETFYGFTTIWYQGVQE